MLKVQFPNSDTLLKFGEFHLRSPLPAKTDARGVAAAGVGFVVVVVVAAEEQEVEDDTARRKFVCRRRSVVRIRHNIIFVIIIINAILSISCNNRPSER